MKRIFLGIVAMCLMALMCACGSGAGNGNAGNAGNTTGGESVSVVEIDIVDTFTAGEQDVIRFDAEGQYYHTYYVDEQELFVTGSYEKKDGKYVLYEMDLLTEGEKIVYAECYGISKDELKVNFVSMKKELTYHCG